LIKLWNKEITKFFTEKFSFVVGQVTYIGWRGTLLLFFKKKFVDIRVSSQMFDSLFFNT
jgi:hypothetical protein